MKPIESLKIFKCLFIQFDLIINSAMSKLGLEIFHMRGSFANLKSRKTFSRGVIDETIKYICPFTRISYVYNFTRCDCLNYHARRAQYWRSELWSVCSVEIFHPSLSFSLKEKSIPNKYTTI